MAVADEAVFEFEKALLSLDQLSAGKIISQWRGPESPIELVEQLLAPALERIGSGWEQGRVALSQVYLSGRICEELVDSILPPLAPARKRHPKMAIAVLEDYHLLGKRIVYSVLRANGYELQDYGHGISHEHLTARALEDGVQILLISTLMLPSALRVKQVTDRLKTVGSDMKVIVGGAPFRFDSDLWREVGADATGRNAGEAVQAVKTVVEEGTW